jgi:hypothetical protein
MITLRWVCPECGHEILASFTGTSIPNPISNELSYQAIAHLDTHRDTPTTTNQPSDCRVLATTMPPQRCTLQEGHDGPHACFELMTPPDEEEE